MKTLYILRHAHAENPIGFSDIERNLSEHGQREADALGIYMKQHNYNPDSVLCSPARRTRQTLEHLSSSTGALDAHFPQELYNAPENELLSLLKATNDKRNSLMIVAHNPGVYALVATLIDDAPSELMSKLAVGYQPATLSILECEVESWKDIQRRENRLVAMIEPKDYL